MRYLYLGEKGTALKEIIERLGNKNYEFIECRYKWKDENGQDRDDFFGACSYKDGVLIPLDGDYYSLDDLCIEWKEFVNPEGKIVLTVWEYGELSDVWNK